MHRYLLNGILFGVLLDKAGDPPPGETDPAKAAKELADLKAENADFKKKFEQFEADKNKKKDPPVDDSDLADKAAKEKAAKEKTAADTKNMEAALTFSLGAKDWLKTNASILPKDIQGIFDAADKEKYENAIEKNGAIKSALVQEFFKLQSNLDLLTSSQKSALEDFLKLTKNAKQERAQSMYDQIFEPTFEMLKRLEKAKQLRSDGHTDGTSSDQAYKDRMMKLSRQHYLGEKAQ